MNLGETIYRLRTERGMSQGTLADALDVSRQSVSKWENNSAVPELDKLLKMSELFGVTLDQLVGRESPTPPITSAPPVIVQTTPPHRTLGIIFLCFGLLVTLLLSILGGFVVGVMAGLPFVIIGSIQIASTEGTLFKSAWALFAIYAPLLFYFMLNFMGFGWGVRIGILVVWFAVLVLLTVIFQRKGKLSADSKRLMVGSIAVAVVLFLLLEIANSMLYQASSLHTDTQEIPISDFPLEEP